MGHNRIQLAALGCVLVPLGINLLFAWSRMRVADAAAGDVVEINRRRQRGLSPEERLRGRKQNASILDSVTRELSFFKKDLGAGDRSRLDTYLENIREIERRIEIAMSKSVREPSGEIPFGLPESKHVHYRLMYDLMALAFEGDITRSATLMLGRDLWGSNFPESGFTGRWHGTSHHGDKPKTSRTNPR